ncbi:MAG: HD-GYP domain-containing protein [Bacillota bacterium]
MRSLKKIIFGIIITIISIIIISVLFNFFYIGNIYENIKKYDSFLHQSDYLYYKMDLPLRVLRNIENQGDISNNSKLKEAYNKNKDRYYDYLSKKIVLLNDLGNFLNKMENYLLIYNLDEFDKLNTNFNQINQKYDKLNKLYEDEINTNFSNLSVDKSYKTYISFENLNRNLIESFSDIKDKMIIRYIIINLIFYLFLIGILIILFIFLYRIGKNDLNYLLKGYSLLSDQDYDIDKLPENNSYFLEEKKIFSSIENIIKEQNFINKVKVLTNKAYFLSELLEILFDTIEDKLNIDRIGVAFINYQKKEIVAEYGVANYDNIVLNTGFNVSFDETSLTDLIDNPKVIFENDLEEKYKERPNSKSLNLIKKEDIKSNAIFPLIIGNQVFGFLFFSSMKKGNFTCENIKIGKKIANEIAGVIDKTYLTKTVFSKITKTFADLVEKKDEETGEHLNRMESYSVFIAKLLLKNPKKNYYIDRKFIKDIENNAAIHDIGKVGVPDKILKKPGKLNKEEWEIIKNHPNIGADIFKSLRETLSIFGRDFYLIAENITRFHHEKWDGTGYPNGLKKHEIPLESRIIAIADVFDAITSKRSYKEAFSFEKSFNIIKDSAGTHLDPYLVKLLVDNRQAFFDLYKKLK